MTVTRQDAEEFLAGEAQILDEARYDEWLSLFTEDATYWVPSQPNQESSLDTVSLIYDDRRLLETRVRRLLAASAHSLDPSPRTSRILASISLAPTTKGSDTTVRSKFFLAEYRGDRQRVFAGTYKHTLCETAAGLRIRAKRVDLVNCDSMLDGLTVPF